MKDKTPRKAQFINFTNELLAGVWEGGSFDGSDVQNMAADNGLIEEQTVTEPCGKNCGCSEFGFPAQCFRKLY